MKINVVIIEKDQEDTVHMIVEQVSKYTDNIVVCSEVGSNYTPILNETWLPTTEEETGHTRFNMVYMRNKGFNHLKDIEHDYTLFLDGDRMIEGDIDYVFNKVTEDVVQIMFPNSNMTQTEDDTLDYIGKHYIDFFSAGFLLSKKFEDDLLKFHGDNTIMNPFFAGNWGNEDRYLAAEAFHLGYTPVELNMKIARLHEWPNITRDWQNSWEILKLLFKKNKIQLPFACTY